MDDATVLAQADLKHRLRLLDGDNRRLMLTQGRLILECNRKVEIHLKEIKLLREDQKRLKKENKELRDLCCFIDDDRQRTKRLCKEWQKFGRYTSHVMKQEVAAYQERLRDLEGRQRRLLEENEELKQVCLFLDEERRQENRRAPKYGSEPKTPIQSNKPLSPSSCLDSPESQEGSRSSDSETQKPESEQHINGFTPLEQKAASLPAGVELKLRELRHEHQLSPVDCKQQARRPTSNNGDSAPLIGYLKTLEERVKCLEHVSVDGGHSTQHVADMEGKLQRLELEPPASEETDRETEVMIASITSGASASSSGTTYASSSSSDPSTAIYLLPPAAFVNEQTAVANNNAAPPVVGVSKSENSLNADDRTLTPIDEHEEDRQIDPLLSRIERPTSAASSLQHAFSDPIQLDAIDATDDQQVASAPLQRSHSLATDKALGHALQRRATIGGRHQIADSQQAAISEAVKMLRLEEMARSQQQRMRYSQSQPGIGTGELSRMPATTWSSLESNIPRTANWNVKMSRV